MDAKKICCPKFDPAPWDNKTFEWENKRFITGKVKTFFYMPIGFSKMMTKLTTLVEENGATMPENLCISDHPSQWNMNLLMATDKEIPGANNVTLNGKYFSKVYEGPFKDTGKWTQNFKEYAITNKLNVKHVYMWYTTCPKCAKEYGKNYVVIIAEI